MSVDVNDGNPLTVTPLAGLNALVVYARGDNKHIQVGTGRSLLIAGGRLTVLLVEDYRPTLGT